MNLNWMNELTLFHKTHISHVCALSGRYNRMAEVPGAALSLSSSGSCNLDGTNKKWNNRQELNG